MLVAHWYEHRELVELDATVTPLPAAVERLIQPYRRMRM